MPSLAIPSPIGQLILEEVDEEIVAIRWSDEAGGNGSRLLDEAAHQLAAYFDHRLTDFDLPLRPAGSDHQQRVWAAMRRIPYGETRSYKDLATEIGSAPRAVGGACGKNPIPIVIPCHRVLGKSGIGGYSGQGGPATKHWLLELEGARLPS